MQQDELAGLFARNMNFSNPTPPPEQQQQVIQKMSEPAPHIIYASSHYVPNPQPRHNEPSPEPEPAPCQPVVHFLSDSEIRDILNRNSINPDTLFLSQVNLLRNAGDDQRLRLLELWHISPPNIGHYDLVKEQASWTETTLNQEEQMARLRYERMMAERQFGNKIQQRQVEDQSMSLEVAQGIERPASAPESRGRSSHGSGAEPYMTSGYELLAQREYERSTADPASNESTQYSQATDPVYRASGTWDKSLENMANRYGAYEQSCVGAFSMVDDMEM
ncbi:hypothetical protein EG328_008936 [Venturia inaequalis]|uniref:Uncharacterized protein n=1 Tax=Venturia inaequalis TaxID=5025 RepID=A0A8H3V908_VENIN|nr:hypothetical protein EG328_008936 [Venturia inaequalis]